MNRAERRRQAREAEKKPFEQRYSLVPIGYRNTITGKVFNNVEDYVCDMEKSIYEKLSEAFAHEGTQIITDMLYAAENFIGTANIIIMLYAIKMTLGDLKTVQKSYQRILDNYNTASQYVDKKGIREAYEELHRDYGVELMFEDLNLDDVFDNEMMQRKLEMKVPHLNVAEESDESK